MRADLARPMERSQLVWRRACKLVDPVEQHDGLAVALDLLRTAHHDPTTIAHALMLGCTQVNRHPGDAQAHGAVKILERTIAFLGVKPRPGDVGAGQSVTRNREARHGDAVDKVTS